MAIYLHQAGQAFYPSYFYFFFHLFTERLRSGVGDPFPWAKFKHCKTELLEINQVAMDGAAAAYRS